MLRDKTCDRKRAIFYLSKSSVPGSWVFCIEFAFLVCVDWIICKYFTDFTRLIHFVSALMIIYLHMIDDMCVKCVKDILWSTHNKAWVLHCYKTKHSKFQIKQIPHSVRMMFWWKTFIFLPGTGFGSESFRSPRPAHRICSAYNATSYPVHSPGQ